MTDSALTVVNDPMTAVPALLAGAVRRTSNIDAIPGGNGSLRLHGHARDVRAEADGTMTVLAETSVVAVLDSERTLRGLKVTPAAPECRVLHGLRVGRGFRAAVTAALLDASDPAPTLALLLTDFPVAVLLSGYQRVYAGGAWDDGAEASTLQPDVCAGWRADGTMVAQIRATGAMSLPRGPAPPPLDIDHPSGWHLMDAQAPGSMRRIRLLDIGSGSRPAIFAMHRDSHAAPDGSRSILHEWSVAAAYDLTAACLLEVRAQPRVLPWPECPAAAASAATLVGRSPTEAREILATSLRPTATCTHLSDLLRGLGDIEELATHRSPSI